MEVIARQSSKANSFVIYIIVMGIGLFLFGAIMLLWLVSTNSFSSGDVGMNVLFAFAVAIPVCTGLFMVIAGGVQKRRYDNTPGDLIVYKEGLLFFAGGYICSPLEIVNVEYERTVLPGARKSVVFPPTSTQDYGSLKVYTKKKTLKFNNVEDVEKAHNRLMHYMMQARHPS